MKKRINTTLSWDEKYPASYEFKPCLALQKIRKENEAINANQKKTENKQ